MDPTLIGYFAKRTLKSPDWLRGPGVEEVCSVSTCISHAPEGCLELWRHNEMWVYDSPDLAWGVVPEAERQDYDLYAYRLFPLFFSGGQQRPFDIPVCRVQPLPATFSLLGYDAVSRSYDNAFECSPLSCNHMAEQAKTNRFCLFDSVDEALYWAAQFDAGRGEPGPYYVVEVWRDGKVGSG